MFRHRKRAYSKPGMWLGGSLVALMGVALALLVPTLGSAQAQAAPVNTAEPQISGSAVQGQTAHRHDRLLVEQPDQLRLPVAPLPVKWRQRRRLQLRP